MGKAVFWKAETKQILDTDHDDFQPPERQSNSDANQRSTRGLVANACESQHPFRGERPVSSGVLACRAACALCTIPGESSQNLAG